MGSLILLLLLAGCATPARRAPVQGELRESHGVYIYSLTYRDASDLCYALAGEKSDGCWIPELKLGIQSVPNQLSKDICLASSDPVACIHDLF